MPAVPGVAAGREAPRGVLQGARGAEASGEEDAGEREMMMRVRESWREIKEGARFLFPSRVSVAGGIKATREDRAE